MNPHTSGPKIAVVGDDSDVVFTITEMLQGFNRNPIGHYRPKSHTDGVVAWLNHVEPALTVWQMPGPTIDYVRELSDIRKQVSCWRWVILASSVLDRTIERNVEVLIIPISVSQLLSAVDNLLHLT